MDSGEVSPPTAQVQPDVAAQIKKLRWWLIGLTIALVLVAITGVSVGGLLLVSSGMFGGFEVSADDASVDDMTAEIEDAYGDRLASVDARIVKVTYGESFGLFGMMDGPESQIAVRYQLKDTPVAFSGLFYDAEEIAYQGFIPARGKLSSRIEDTDLRALLSAYASETARPAGGVMRYGDTPDEGMEGRSLEQTITVSGKQYASADLWNVIQSRDYKGDSVDIDAEGENLAFVFHRDPVTGAFSFVGTEPAFMY